MNLVKKSQETKLIYRNLLHFYTLTNNEISESEIMETIPLCSLFVVYVRYSSQPVP